MTGRADGLQLADRLLAEAREEKRRRGAGRRAAGAEPAAPVDALERGGVRREGQAGVPRLVRDRSSNPEAGTVSGDLSIELPPALVDAVAERVLGQLEERGLTSPGEDGWLRGARAIADYIGAKPDRIYALHAAGRIDCVENDGSALVAKKPDLDRWIRQGGGIRT